jgi:RHS repeat-associated protein
MNKIRYFLSIAVCGIFFMLTLPAQAVVTYIHTDILGSPVAESDNNGTLIKKLHYKPFGETLEAKQNTVGYTGHMEDKELGLTYMQARYYDPLIGRFYSNDPVGYSSENPLMSFNRYIYVNNNPYKYTDPNGEFLFLLPLIGAISGGYTAYQAAGDMGASGNAQIVAGLGGALAGAFTGGTTAVASKAVAFTAKTVAKTAVSSSLATTGKLTAGAVTGAISSGSGQAIGDALSDLSQGNKPDVDMNKVASKAAIGAGEGMLGAIPGASLTLSPAKKLVANAVGVGVVAAKKELERN